MEDVKGKVAFITGGGAGMGLGMAKAFARHGMKVVISDVRRNALDRAMDYFEKKKQPVYPIVLDVTDRDAYAKAADEAECEFEKIHVLVNNAGVASGGPLAKATYKDWDFAFGVKVNETINGITTILPRIIAHGEGGHVVSTASTNGFSVTPNFGIYSSSMFAVTGMMESLASELDGTNVGASVFFPGPVMTELGKSTFETRPDHLKNEGEAPPQSPPKPPKDAPPPKYDMMKTLKTPEEIGERVLRGIKRNDLFIITHPEFREGIIARMEALLRAIPNETIDPDRWEIIKMFGAVGRNPYYDKQTTPGEPDWDLSYYFE